MPDSHANLAYSLVATAPSPASSGTSLVVTAAQGSRFPAVPFNATIWPIGTIPTPANAEIVRVTAISTDTLTITRAQESSSARSVIVGDQIAATVTAKTLTDFESIPVPQGRLTLQTAVPVMITDQAAKTVIYYTPHVGSYVPIYDGSHWNVKQFSELSNDTTQSSTGSAGPAAVVNNSNYDLFVWSNAGVLTLTRGPVWTSDTARGTGAGTTQITMVNGIYTNTVAITNGPGAGLGTYVGTVRSNGSAQIDWKLGTAAALGGMATLGVWNAYNRTQVFTNVQDSTLNYNYTSATIRAAQASNANRVNFVCGLALDSIDAYYEQYVGIAAAVAAYGQIGVKLDATNAFDREGIATNSVATGYFVGLEVTHGYGPQLGFHFVQAVEASDGTHATNYNPIMTALNGLNVKGLF